MLLRFEQIKEISFGAASITQEDGVLTYHKCTDKQLQAVENYQFKDNAMPATGCCLDFYTDSDFFAFAPVSGIKYELYINGALQKRFRFDQKFERVCVDLPEGENRITLILPSHGKYAKISAVELSDGAKFNAHSYKTKMAFFGDSITQGWDSSYNSLSFAWQVARFFDAEVWNTGIGGNVFIKDFADKRSDFDPDTVMVAYGTNDYFVRQSGEEFEENLYGFLENIAKLYQNSRVFVMLPLWRGDVKGTVKPWGDFETHRMMIKAAAEKYQFNIIDAYDFVPHNRDFFADDIMLHPNDLGFGIYAQNIIKALLPHIF